jgi:hypothetical protein
MAHPLLAKKQLRGCSKIWPSLSPPRVVVHNSQTVQSCIFLGSTEFPLRCLTHSDCCLVFPPQSNDAFINFKNSSGSAVSLLLCVPKNFMFELCHIWQSFRFLASLFHNYGTWEIGISTIHVSTTKARAGFRRDCARLLRKACLTGPVWLIGPRRSVGF